MEERSFRRWAEFYDFVLADRQVMPTCWRGQKDPNWPLASPFERQMLRLNGGGRKGASNDYPYDGRFTPAAGGRYWDDTLYKSMRDRYLMAFKGGASGLRGVNPAPLSDDQWWALGRHYGLVTPLLDWTEKPFIAVYFALSDLYRELKESGAPGGPISFIGREVAIYRLFHNPELTALESQGLRVVRPLVEELDRLQGQRGMFTWLDSEDYFELQGFLDHKGMGKLLTRIRLSDQALTDGLQDLHKHGIDHRLLFPDLLGAAEYANRLWDIWL